MENISLCGLSGRCFRATGGGNKGRGLTGPRGASPVPSSEETRRTEGEQIPCAAEHGRGRHATAPWQIPWTGWKDILGRTYQNINDNRLLAVAAGVVFYGLLSIFPAISAFVSIYGLVADASTSRFRISLWSPEFFRAAQWISCTRSSQGLRQATAQP